MNKDEDLFCELLRTVVSGLGEYLTDNFDEMRFGRQHVTPVSFVKDWASRFAFRLGFVRLPPARQKLLLDRLERLQAHTAEWDRVSRLLEDDASRNLLVALLAYRILGYLHIRLPLSSTAQRKDLKQRSDSLIAQSNLGTISMGSISWPVNRYDLKDAGYDIQYEGLDVTTTFLLEQYCFRRKTCPEIGIRPGDIVVDGGACTGDSALYAAWRAGDNGKVFCFECDQDNLTLLKRNLNLNPLMARRVQPMPFALWDRSGETLTFDSAGPGTHVSGTMGKRSVSTLSIDDLVRNHTAPRVDFIKLDVEGAELRVLQGAETVLRTFQPRLAISVYHKERDMFEIPLWIDNLKLGYRFHLDHFTIYGEETVLFATAAS